MERHFTAFINELLTLFPCVAITGVRQSGKTTALRDLPPPWQRYDLETASDYDLVARDPDLFLRLNPKQVALDEAQLLPAVFPALRVAIDADRNSNGRFFITGSSSPELLHSISESLAGRVAMVEVAPLMMSEAFAQPPSGLYELIQSRRLLTDFASLQPSNTDLQQHHDYWLRGGYPEPWLKNNARFHKLWMQNYVKTYLERDILRLFPSLQREKYQLFLQMLAQLSGTIINYSDVARTLGISPPTAREYFRIAHGTFIWRHIPPYEKNAAKRIVKHPKGYLRDSGLLHHFLHLYTQNDLLAHPQMGHSWETMVIENLIRGLNAQGILFDYYHYRTSAGAEVDLVLEGEFGLLPIEIKYKQTVSLRDLKGIHSFIEEYQCPYGIVVSNNDRLGLVSEKLINVPFRYV
ncbi:MAG: ATP-binding protein [Candidatus Thiothrix putei]|uniref:ATP-binding protein n=1 Tax=Candidatus Thiothrix putei TaxID=3080811 RepID=A0AA95KQ22_9GAMM|nr:MAG: ATP-binding protein [Candidatus Thiothrix putei]